jgi:hypothetical protein
MSLLDELPERIVPHVRLLIDVATQQTSARSLGKVCNEMAAHYRALGICLLLTEAESDAFFHWLIQSALTRKYYLGRSAAEGVLDDFQRRASVTGPFFDALASGQWGLARQIAALSPTTWWKEREYEDDFAYAFFLHTFIREPANTATLQGALDQYARVLAGGSDARLELCGALLAKDPDAFLKAFPSLLSEHDSKMKKLAATREYEYTYEPNRYVMVEGLALLKLAESLGFDTEAEYPLCPSVARRADYAPFKPLGFPNLGLES